MSISALSSNLIADLSQQQRQSPFKEIKQDFRQLASALQSGDLSDAQSAYSSIQQLLQANQGSSASGTGSSGLNTLQTDFAAVGQALQSGDLSQAQSAFSQLQSDAQAGRPSRAANTGAPTQGQDQYVSQTQNPVQEALQDYTQLASDLQSGDLTDARTAYSNLQQLVQGNQNSSATQTDFAALGQALQSGDVSQAQSAFSQFQTDLEGAPQPTTANAATTTAPPAPAQNPVQQVRQDYGQLASALQSGNLANAQSAFAALEQALQTQTGSNASSTASSTTSSDPIANDLNTLGQALSSGSLTQAQSAFSQLQNDIQNAQQSGTSHSQRSERGQRAEGHHHHHHGGGGFSYTSSNTNSSVSVYA